MANALEARPVCYRCNKPRVTCICEHVRRVSNRTPVWIVQHPRERRHPLGTVRIARLGLDDVHLEISCGHSEQPPTSLPDGAGLLYPAPGARDLATLAAADRPAALIVIDGTWAQANKLYREQVWLHRLPHYRLTPPHESRYRLRKEPAADCVSTIEAIVHALRIIEPHTPGLDDLLGSFDAMIDEQVALIDSRRSGRRKRDESRSHHGVPRRHLADPQRLVAVGIEAAPRTGPEPNALAIIQCVALRLATGEVFQQFLQPPPGRFPTSWHLQHMGLRAEQLQGGGTSQTLRQSWQRFIAGDDIVVAWNHRVLEALDALVTLPRRRLHLKSAYRSHAKQARGSLAELTAQLGLEFPAPASVRGRAGRHVVQVAALLKHLAELP